MSGTLKALFLSHSEALAPGGGGQQQCTREYRDTLRMAGFDFSDVTFKTDRKLLTRLHRKLSPAPYADLIPDEFVSRAAAAARAERPAFVFCNLHDFIAVAPVLRKQLPCGTKLVLLSHGLASVDDVHAARIAGQGIGTGRLAQIPPEWLARRIMAESAGLPAFDHVFCLAPFETGVCRWLGARSVSWLPRTLRAGNSLSWKPTGNRAGIVGTLDHPPNLEGVELVCNALRAIGPGKLRLRVVTHSHGIGADLAARYEFVDYLGSLLEPGAVEEEAATWSAFVHPIFCHAMGCSTKVATGLGWGLPVITTAAGLRGYSWRQGEIGASDSPGDLARAVLAALDPARAIQLREEAAKVVRSAPTLHEVAAQMRLDLGLAGSAATV